MHFLSPNLKTCLRACCATLLESFVAFPQSFQLGLGFQQINAWGIGLEDSAFVRTMVLCMVLCEVS